MFKPASLLISAALVFLLALVLMPAPASAAGYGFSIGYGHYGHHYGGHHGYRYHGYRHYGYRHYPHRYSYKRHYYRPYGYRRHYGSYGYHKRKHHSPLYSILAAPAYLAYGILKTPAVIIDSLSGSDHHDSGYYSEPARRQPHTNTQPRADNTTAATTDAGTLLDSPGWEALAQGYSRTALERFAAQAEAQPTAGEPKIGYALAAASGGDLDRGIWAMKRALRYDSDALVYLQFDGALRQSAGQLIDHYQRQYSRVHKGGYPADVALMIGALHHLRGEAEAARTTIAEARRHGDTDELVRLARLLESDHATLPKTTAASRIAGR